MRTPARFTALAALVLLAGCTNPFTPARPESPSSGPSVVEKFDTPDNLLTTIESAMSVRGLAGQTAYYDALADSTTPDAFAFYAFHSPGDISTFHAQTGLTPDPVWSVIQERPFFGYLGDQAIGLVYHFNFSTDDQESALTTTDTDVLAVRRKHYQLVATSEDGNTERFVALGNADLYMQKVGGRWYLYRWEDRTDTNWGPTPSDPNMISMGRLRLNSTTGHS